jgi:sugar phosphate isomerase/epimerase
MVKLGFHTIHFSPSFGGAEACNAVIKACAQVGFDAVGFDVWSLDAHLKSGGSVEQLGETISEQGLICSDIASFQPSPRLDASRAALEVANTAVLLGAPLVVIAPTAPISWEDLLTQCRAAAHVFNDFGLRGAIEFIPHYSLKTLAMARELCAEIGWDKAGLVLDSYHFFQGATSLSELSELTAAEIALVQYSDARVMFPDDRIDESRNRRLLPGQGCLALSEWSSVLLDKGYDGVVSAEVLSEEFRHIDVAELAEACYRAMLTDWHPAVPWVSRR